MWTWATTWWSIVLMISVINLAIGIYIFIQSRKEKTSKMNYRKMMAITGLIFLSVAMYRSIFISRYLTQLAWFDSFLNSSLLIRSFAVFAEISLAFLIMNGLLHFNKEFEISEKFKNSTLLQFFINKAPRLLLILIIVAQPFAYGGLFFKLRILFAIEETLWGIGFLLIIPLVLIQVKMMFSLKDKSLKQSYVLYRMMTMILALFSVGYVFYSLFYHLPIEYWPAAIDQVRMATPEPEITFSFQAIWDSLVVINPTRDYDAWGGMGFVIWQTGYFTICGWIALILMSGPRILTNKKEA